MEEILSFIGTVVAIIYENEQNGYAVIKLQSDEGEEITANGIMPGIACGEKIEAFGNWQTHKTYGFQFLVETYEVSLPSTEKGMIDYLGSGIIKGIGRKLAEKIVDNFGLSTFEIIANNPNALADIDGISVKKAYTISQNFAKITHIRFIIDFLIEYSLPIEVASKAYKRFSDDAVNIMTENPYILCDDYFGVDFLKIDEIADSLGVDRESDMRSKAGVLYVLRHNLTNGHSFIPLEKLKSATSSLLEQEIDQITQNIEELMLENSIFIENIANVSAVYLNYMYYTEDYVSRYLLAFEEYANKIDINIDEFIGEIEMELGKTYEESQKNALRYVASGGVFILTGGPGTGKTTTVEGIIHVLEAMGLSVELCAPTGRAAKRMSEVCGREAKTIHRLLEPNYDMDSSKMVFAKNEENKIETDAIIVDEASMIDINLIEGLLKALKFGTKIIFVGDPDQLPPVGAGNFLSDVISSGRFNVISLTEVFRQAKESLIVLNAHNVNRGQGLLPAKKDGDFFFKHLDNEGEMLDEVVSLCKERLVKHYSINQAQIQVISPSKKNKAGTISINQRLQETLNPAKDKLPEKRFGNLIFRQGDKVMQIRNNYDIMWIKGDTSGIGIFNGEIGEIIKIDMLSETLSINFDDKIALYSFEMLNELDLAYALTVHKSQGSEFDVVVMVIPNNIGNLMTRNVLYTGITRAKKLLVLVGDKEALCKMIENNRKRKRYSGLKIRIIGTSEDAIV